MSMIGKMTENILIPGPVSKVVISSLIEALSNDTGAGGHSVFIGQVRADNDGERRVQAILYSAYESMVKAEAEKIKKMIFEEYNDVKQIVILHSEGLVKAGEISLFVMVSSGHRHQAMQACARTVDLIKEMLPVWKKEIFDDNTHEWRENKQY